MTRFVRLAAAALAALLLAAGAAAQDSDSLIRFRKAFFDAAVPAPAAERIAATRGVALAGGRSAAEMACRALAETLDRVEAMAKERSSNREEEARLLGGARPGGAASPPVDAAKRLKEIREREEVLRRSDEEERFVAAELRRALLAFRDPKALEFLGGSALHGSPSGAVRAAAAEALGASTWEGAGKALRSALRDKDPQVREAVLAALGRAGAREKDVLDALAAALDDPRWTVRLAAARRLAVLGVPESVDLLVARLAKEDGRLRRDLSEILRALTGQRFGVEPEGWSHWWKDNREAYASGAKALAAPVPGAPPPAEDAGAAGSASYWGITTHSRRILYVVDVSGSMTEPGASAEGARIDDAKKELLRSLRALDGASAFTIYSFSDAVRKWRPGLVKATPEAKEDARGFVDALDATNWTNTFGALEEAFRSSAADPRNNMGEEYGLVADTIFLLTDGAPTTPAGKPRDAAGREEWVRVLEAVRDWNRDKRVSIHCVGVGAAINADFLSALARENGGRFVQVK